MVVDLNARNPLWSSQVTHAKGRKLEGIISDFNFNMPNRSLSDINFVKKTSRLNVYGKAKISVANGFNCTFPPSPTTRIFILRCYGL